DNHLKTGQRITTFGTLIPAGADRLRRHEQCLERIKETTAHRTGKARLAAAAYRAGDRCASRNGGGLPQGRGNRSASCRWMRTPVCLETAKATNEGGVTTGVDFINCCIRGR